LKVHHDRRSNRRIKHSIKADLTFNEKHYKAVIENFSETGIFKIVFPEKSVIEFFPGNTLEVNLLLPAKQQLTLECEIKWVRIKRGSPLFLKYHMGLKIIEPPREYKEFIQTLLRTSVEEQAVV
jgi:hypothetical protein